MTAKMAEQVIHNESRPQSQSLIGVYALCITILIFLFGQTGGIAYWAGGIAKSQETTAERVRELQSKLDKLQGNYDVLNMQYAEIKAAQEIANNKKGR